MKMPSSFTHEYIIPLIVAVVAVLVLSVLPKRRVKLKWTLAAITLLSGLAAGLLYFDSRKPDEQPDRVIAGTTIDAATQASIPGAIVSIVGRAEKCTSESTGKFRIQLDSDFAIPDFVLLHVEKPGFSPYEESVRPGVHDFEVSLQRISK
jgi:hypothetical protein